MGKSLLTIPEQVETDVKLNGLKRWTLLKTLNAQIQQRWLKEYLHSHHIYYRWQKAEQNLQVEDIVGLRESGFSKQRIPMAKIIQVYPGVDGLVRVVKLYTGKEEIKRAVQRLVLLLPVDDLLPAPPRMLILSRREYVQASPHRLKRIRHRVTSTSFIMYTHTHTYITVFISIHCSQPAGLHSYRYIASSLQSFSIIRVFELFGCYVTKH